MPIRKHELEVTEIISRQLISTSTLKLIYAVRMFPF